MLGGKLHLSKIKNVDLARRNLLVHPPEPPIEIVFPDPLNSVYVGRTKIFNVPFYWSYENVANPHIAVVGISGSGKSYFIKTFLLRSSYVWNANALIIDWAGEYKDWVRQTGGKIISLGKGSFLNLLDLGGMKPYNRIKQIMRTLGILTDIDQYPEQKRLTEQALEKAYIKAKYKMDRNDQKDELGKGLTPPTLRDVVNELKEQATLGTYEFPAELENAIYRLKQFTRSGEDFFAQQSTVSLDEITTSGLVDLDLSGLPDETFRALGALTILQFLKEKMRLTGWESKKGVKFIIVLDEAWKIAGDEKSDAVMIIREGRKYNFCMIVASQNPTDINEAIFSNVGTTFILKIKFDKYLDYLQSTLNFSNYMRNAISKFGVGECAVNMAFTTPTQYPPTFLISKIEGEEPAEEYFLDLELALTPEQKKKMEFNTRVAFLKKELTRKLVQYGLNLDKVKETISAFEKEKRHLGVVKFVIMLERYGIARQNISKLLKESGLDDRVIISIFAKARSGGV